MLTRTRSGRAGDLKGREHEQPDSARTHGCRRYRLREDCERQRVTQLIWNWSNLTAYFCEEKTATLSRPCEAVRRRLPTAKKRYKTQLSSQRRPLRFSAPNMLQSALCYSKIRFGQPSRYHNLGFCNYLT